MAYVQTGHCYFDICIVRFVYSWSAVSVRAKQELFSPGYFIKYLDQININNAFVSGMKEDLGLYGNELNYMQTCWTVGYVIGEIPSNILLTRLKPRYWIPAAEVGFSNFQELIPIRTSRY